MNKELEEHLRSCPCCNAEVNALRASLSLAMETATGRVPEPSAAFVCKLRQRIEQSKEVNRIFITMPKWAAALAAIILLTLGTIVTLRFAKKNPPLSFSQENNRASQVIREGENSLVAGAQKNFIRNTPEMQMLTEMLPVSQPYINAWIAALRVEYAQEKIMSTLEHTNYELLQRVLNLLESSAAALEEFSEEEELSWKEEII